MQVRLKNDVLKEKPRHLDESILNKQTLSQIVFEGIIIALCTMCAYGIGLNHNSQVASTMAFATICLARLLHGLNCRSYQPLTQIGLLSNMSSIYALFIGLILLHLILFVPALQHLFLLQSVTFHQLLVIYLFAFIPTVIIQIKKYISKNG